MNKISFTIRLADHTFQINAMHQYVHQLCQDYICEDAKDTSNFIVKTTQHDIEFEREQSRIESEYEGIPVIEFADDYYEAIAVYRKIILYLLSDNIILIHGSCLAMNGEAYLFTAKSGTGKSTHARIWREQFGDQVTMINDDKPLLKITDQGVIAFGTPWDGKHRLSNNTAVPLKGIVYLERGAQNQIARMPVADMLPVLYQQIFRPDDPLQLVQTLKLIDKMSAKVNYYKLQCNMETEAAHVARQGLTREDDVHET